MKPESDFLRQINLKQRRLALLTTLPVTGLVGAALVMYTKTFEAIPAIYFCTPAVIIGLIGLGLSLKLEKQKNNLV